MKKILALFLAALMISSLPFAIAEGWLCPSCGRSNQGNFCPDCGTQKPEPWVCPSCGKENASLFCENCGAKRPEEAPAVLTEALAIPTGTWEFSDFGLSLFLTIRDNSEYTIIIQGRGRIAGNYENVDGNIIFSSNGTALYWGSYNAEDDTFVIDGAAGKGRRTENVPMFRLRMDGGSMDDMIADGQILSVECRNAVDFQRFDIVVTNYPDRGDTLFVKRMVGLPGDTVELNGGHLYINGEKYDEPYIRDEYRHGSLNTFGPVVVPEGCYFVVGDHRNNSNDSRSVGSIPTDLMVGVVTAIDGTPVNNPLATDVH